MMMMMMTISKHPGRPEPRTTPHHKGGGGTESSPKPRTIPRHTAGLRADPDPEGRKGGGETIGGEGGGPGRTGILYTARAPLPLPLKVDASKMLGAFGSAPWC